MIYINTDGNHYKFWGYSSEKHSLGWAVTTYWGKIGTPLATCPRKIFIFRTEASAEYFIENKLREKRNKGYRLPNDKLYEEMFGTEDNSYLSMENELKELAKNIDIY